MVIGNASNQRIHPKRSICHWQTCSEFKVTCNHKSQMTMATGGSEKGLRKRDAKTKMVKGIVIDSSVSAHGNISLACRNK